MSSRAGDLAGVVSTSDAVAATRSRSRKIALLADLLRGLDPQDVDAAVGFLAGVPRQGRIGVGWATVASVTTPASPQSGLTIADLDHAIDDLQAASGPGSAARRREILGTLFSRATAPEQDFVRRLLVGELRQGALEGVLVEAVARAAEVAPERVRRAVMVCGDLATAARTALRDPDELARLSFRVLRPLKPMLASTAADVHEAFDGLAEASVEWKLDGIRIQVHRLGDEVRIYTRNLNDCTPRLPGIAEQVRQLDVSSIVLDGEAIMLDDDERALHFQDVMSRFGRDEEPAPGMRAFVFDCLHVDGADLIDDPLSARLQALERAAGPLKMPGLVTEDPDRATGVLRDALQQGHEGVVVKDTASAYVAGRRGKAWRKVKPVRTLDLVVLGAEWGHGRRRGWLSNLHLGARGPDGGFVMVGKTFKGLTDAILRWQTAELLARETHREGIVVFVRPELVAEIALDGVQRSTRYPGGVALRFARVRAYRPDKSPVDADTIGTVRAMLP